MHRAATQIWGAAVAWQPLAVAGAVALVAGLLAIALAGRLTRRSAGPEAMTFDAARQAWAAGRINRPPRVARRWGAFAGAAMLVGVASLTLAAAVVRDQHRSTTVADVRPQAGTAVTSTPAASASVPVTVPTVEPDALPAAFAADGGLTQLTDAKSRQTASSLVTSTEQGSSYIAKDQAALYALAGTAAAAAVVEVGQLTTPLPADTFVSSVLGAGGAKATDITPIATGNSSLALSCGEYAGNGVCSWSTGTIFGLMIYYARDNVHTDGDLTLQLIDEIAAG